MFRLVAARDKRTVERQSVKLLPPLVSAAQLVGKTVLWANIPAESTARQLTLINFDVYHQLEAEELLRIHKTFDDAPHAREMVQYFNRASAWIVSTIVSEESVAERAGCIAYFLNVSKHLRDMNNWDSVMVVASALSTTSVSRLTATWALVPREEAAYFSDILEGYPRKNFKALRQAMQSCKVVGLRTEDVTFFFCTHPLEPVSGRSPFGHLRSRPDGVRREPHAAGQRQRELQQNLHRGGNLPPAAAPLLHGLLVHACVADA